MIWSVLGAVVAAVASVVAAVAARGTARQVQLWRRESSVTTVQDDGREDSAARRDQARRDAYRQFLEVTSQGRTELSALWHLMRGADVAANAAAVESRLYEARMLVYQVQRATNDLRVHGPVGLRRPGEHVEREISFFYATLRSLWTHMVDGAATVGDAAHLCAAQRTEVRISIELFAEAARAASGGPDAERHLAENDTRTLGDLADLSWLTKQIHVLLGIPLEQVEPRHTLPELGFDSGTFLELAREVQHRYQVTPRMVWLLNDRSVAEVATRLTLWRTADRS